MPAATRRSGPNYQEAHELLEAAGETGEQGRRHLIYESSDVIYHMLVPWSITASSWKRWRRTARRFGQSGLDEKASRTVVASN
jgi:phosphoribosyl-ATP pyrophosphohydrolase